MRILLLNIDDLSHSNCIAASSAASMCRNGLMARCNESPPRVDIRWASHQVLVALVCSHLIQQNTKQLADGSKRVKEPQ